MTDSGIGDYFISDIDETLDEDDDLLTAPVIVPLQPAVAQVAAVPAPALQAPPAVAPQVRTPAPQVQPTPTPAQAPAPWLLLGAKTLSYAVNIAALRYAHRQGADDVIFTSADGRVLEGPTSTVLLAHLETSDDGAGGVRTIRRLITPQLDSGILPGTSQGALFTAAKAAGWELGYGPLEPKDLLDADAVWLISSIRLLAPVNHIDGQEIGTPELRRQLTAELNALFATIE